MASNHLLHLSFLFLLFTFTSASFISYDALAAAKSTGRSLLQAKKDCPVNMEAQNYTIITSKCKGPNYPPKSCCDALLEFSCGFVDELNDLTNNCAETMFSYINLYGQYPPGLFANECKEGKEGLSCDKALSEAKNAKGEGGKSAGASSSLPTISSAVFLMLLVYLLF